MSENPKLHLSSDMRWRWYVVQPASGSYRTLVAVPDGLFLKAHDLESWKQLLGPFEHDEAIQVLATRES